MGMRLSFSFASPAAQDAVAKRVMSEEEFERFTATKALNRVVFRLYRSGDRRSRLIIEGVQSTLGLFSAALPGEDSRLNSVQHAACGGSFIDGYIDVKGVQGTDDPEIMDQCVCALEHCSEKIITQYREAILRGEIIGMVWC